MDKGLKFAVDKINEVFANAATDHAVIRSQDQKREELEDWYSNLLYDMDEEELDQEYADKVGSV